jgi:hypothetical protein
MNDQAAVPFMNRLDRFPMSQEERSEDDVKPHCRQHQRPERRGCLARFDHGGKTKMAGKHLTCFTGQI